MNFFIRRKLRILFKLDFYDRFFCDDVEMSSSHGYEFLMLRKPVARLILFCFFLGAKMKREIFSKQFQ